MRKRRRDSGGGCIECSKWDTRQGTILPHSLSVPFACVVAVVMQRGRERGTTWPEFVAVISDMMAVGPSVTSFDVPSSTYTKHPMKALYSPYCRRSSECEARKWCVRVMWDGDV